MSHCTELTQQPPEASSAKHAGSAATIYFSAIKYTNSKLCLLLQSRASNLHSQLFQTARTFKLQIVRMMKQTKTYVLGRNPKLLQTQPSCKY